MTSRFPARRFLKVVSLFLGVLVFGLLAAIVFLSLFGDGGHGPEGAWVFGGLLLIPGLFVLKFINDSFSVLELDEKGLRVRKVIGGVDLEWAQIGSVVYWEQLQSTNWGTSREWFIELKSSEGRRLLRLKSSYEREAFAFLIEQARARNIRIDQ